jgi:hypothetical protein
LVAIANHANHGDGYCWLSLETISRESSTSPRGIIRIVAALIKNGFVKKEIRKGGDGKQRANDYWILFARAEAAWIGQTDKDDADEQTQDIVDAENKLSPESHGGEQPESHGGEPAESYGPSDSADTHIDSEEPSKSNLKKVDRFGKKESGLRSYAPKAPPLAAGWYERQGLEGKALRVICEVTNREDYFYNKMGGPTSVCYQGEITDQLLALADAPRKSEWLTLNGQQAASWFQFATKVFPNARINLRAGSKAPWPWPPRKNGLISNSQAPPLEDPLSDEDAAQIRKAG